MAISIETLAEVIRTGDAVVERVYTINPDQFKQKFGAVLTDFTALARFQRELEELTNALRALKRSSIGAW